jgi:hypothetical protein
VQQLEKIKVLCICPADRSSTTMRRDDPPDRLNLLENPLEKCFPGKLQGQLYAPGLGCQRFADNDRFHVIIEATKRRRPLGAYWMQTIQFVVATLRTAMTPIVL